jgi:hypothetical protein
MNEHTSPAWVELPTEAAIRRLMTPGHPNPYDFGFLPAMSRLLLAHDKIGPPFRTLFRRIMFEAGALNRREREMVAAVTAAAQDCHY